MQDYSSLEIIGISILSLVFILIFISLFKGIWTCFLGHKLGFGIKWKTGDNVWAVITGATDGIGLEYAKQLAKIGYNLVIISRNEDKLKATQMALKQNYSNGSQIHIICADLNQTDIYETIERELNKFQYIHVLVNNIGTIYHIPEYFLQIPSDFNESYFTLNMLASSKLIQIILPKMVEKRSGIIINVTSQLADFPNPLLASYCASKAFLTYLSQSLSVEYESDGVCIQTVLPGLVTTKLSTNLSMPLISVTPEDYVKAAIKTVGIEYRTYGHWKHKLLAYFSKISIDLLGVRLFMKSMVIPANKLRLRYYKKNQVQIT